MCGECSEACEKHDVCWSGRAQISFGLGALPLRYELLGGKEEVKSVARNLNKRREKVSEMLEVEDQALLFIKRSEIYNRGLRRRDLVHGSVLEMGIHF